MSPVVLDQDGHTVENFQILNEQKDDSRFTASLKYEGQETFRLGEIQLFDAPHGYEGDCEVYGEGYQMLTQSEGTLSQRQALTKYTDEGHYRLPSPQGMATVHNLLHFEPMSADSRLLAFSSCRRFAGEFRYDGQSLQIALCGDGILVEPGDVLELEDFIEIQGPREKCFQILGQEMAQNHPILTWSQRPTGWCSWYCYGPEVTEQDITDNMAALGSMKTPLDYIQIDDGYQAAMGDWLLQDKAFPTPIKDLCQNIRSAGKKPAIWIAPFIAEEGSKLFQEHPEYFVQDDEGKPLRSDRITFGGWRRGPWYMLDGTHPEARDYLRHVVKTMRDEWGVAYFKMDANVWGALGGRYHDPKAGRVEAYRRGMEAIVDEVGKDCFLLGCNAPMWPSLGLVHGMRVTGDVFRSNHHFYVLAREGLYRNWQHGTLWLNDPDCIVLDNLVVEQITPGGDVEAYPPLTQEAFLYHATYIAATGGMLLSGDRLPSFSPRGQEILDKVAALPGEAALFSGTDFERGELQSDEGHWLFLLNHDENESRQYSLPQGAQAYLLPKTALLKEDSLELPPFSGAIFSL
ncbi:MAG: alpha-galactosidase [Spirochaetales bacterium]|nr:alpha-galactosidase [Spirochaetales bacterium]